MIRVPKRYIPKHLSKKDKHRYKKSLIKSKRLYKRKKYHTRKKVKSFKSKKSNHITNAKRIYKIESIKPSRILSKKTGCSLKTLKMIEKKGLGAYYSSGSRPNQTPQSWGRARLASVITAGKASQVDLKLLTKGCKKNSKALKLALKLKKKNDTLYKRRAPSIRI